jgi:outer membrane lipoprotein SlyB
MKIGNTFTKFGLLAALAAGEALAATPQVLPAVMVYESGMTATTEVQPVVYRRRRRVRRYYRSGYVRTRSKKKSAAIIGGTAAGGAAIGALAGGGKGAAIGAIAGGGAGLVYDQATRKKRE